MKEIITDWKPRNNITTPFLDIPTYTSSGIIKATTKYGDKISVAQIDYQEFDEENFQYVFTPYWEIIDNLPPTIFQGIPGIDMDLRLNKYYRVNYIPTFITERTPAKNREDLWELLESVGLDYYDRFEWLLRTKMTCGNDNLIVEKKNPQVIKDYQFDILSTLQYGDKIIVESLEELSDKASSFNDVIYSILTNGIDVIKKNGDVLIDYYTREKTLNIVITQRIIKRNQYNLKRQEGINKAKKNNKYTGRKPLEVDEVLLRQVKSELDNNLITIEEAIKRTKLGSKSTFYRKLKALNQDVNDS